MAKQTPAQKAAAAKRRAKLQAAVDDALRNCLENGYGGFVATSRPKRIAEDIVDYTDIAKLTNNLTQIEICVKDWATRDPFNIFKKKKPKVIKPEDTLVFTNGVGMEIRLSKNATIADIVKAGGRIEFHKKGAKVQDHVFVHKPDHPANSQAVMPRSGTAEEIVYSAMQRKMSKGVSVDILTHVKGFAVDILTYIDTRNSVVKDETQVVNALKRLMRKNLVGRELKSGYWSYFLK